MVQWQNKPASIARCDFSSFSLGFVRFKRVWFNGRIGAFQAFDAGSIPATRSKK
jgi:hypothetical protein